MARRRSRLRCSNAGEARFGRVFAQTYGQAESPMVITCLRPKDHDRIGSCGRPFTIVEVAVFDENDRPVPAGERGEIVCRGPQTMAYYWDNPEATAAAFRSGWLHTGDIGYMDDDGFFYLVDRKNDMLISGRLQRLSARGRGRVALLRRRRRGGGHRPPRREMGRPRLRGHLGPQQPVCGRRDGARTRAACELQTAQGRRDLVGAAEVLRQQDPPPRGARSGDRAPDGRDRT